MQLLFKKWLKQWLNRSKQTAPKISKQQFNPMLKPILA